MIYTFFRLEDNCTASYSITLSRNTSTGRFGIGNYGNTVAFIEPKSPAYNNIQIREGDKLCFINGVEISDATSTKAVSDMFRNGGNSLTLVAKRGNKFHVYVSIYLN